MKPGLSDVRQKLSKHSCGVSTLTLCVDLGQIQTVTSTQPCISQTGQTGKRGAVGVLISNFICAQGAGISENEFWADRSSDKTCSFQDLPPQLNSRGKAIIREPKRQSHGKESAGVSGLFSCTSCFCFLQSSIRNITFKKRNLITSTVYYLICLQRGLCFKCGSVCSRFDFLSISGLMVQKRMLCTC